MTPQREEAERMLRLARRDQVAFNVLLAAPGVALPLALFHAQQAVEKAAQAVVVALMEWAEMQSSRRAS